MSVRQKIPILLPLPQQHCSPYPFYIKFISCLFTSVLVLHHLICGGCGGSRKWGKKSNVLQTLFRTIISHYGVFTVVSFVFAFVFSLRFVFDFEKGNSFSLNTNKQNVLRLVNVPLDCDFADRIPNFDFSVDTKSMEREMWHKIVNCNFLICI